MVPIGGEANNIWYFRAGMDTGFPVTQAPGTGTLVSNFQIYKMTKIEFAKTGKPLYPVK